ncbi:unnamed protein product [Adineta steineri]|uniref:Uncharacterized protein n=1 Tax=Adineta steineri TaxID=433720 RepID=A0A814KDC2_9BILA|nr:unnamed protein product [Adineta steineri]CAF1275740.1 unnamed protein product [Adineta steineri]
MFTASLLGGRLSDKAGKYYGDNECPEGRLVPSLALSILSPTGLIIYGWAFHYKLHVSVPIIGQVLLSFGQSILEPAVSAYLTIKKQEAASAVSAANTFLNLCAAGALVTVGVPLHNVMGTGPYFSLMCGINIVTITAASILVYKRIRQARHTAKQRNGMTLKLKKHQNSTMSPKNRDVVAKDEYHDIHWF